jgi:membrane fusion protein, cation efflux system
MKPIQLASSIFAVSLALGTPTITFAHVGHGDEFQAQGGVQRVQVKSESDQMLGISVTPIAAAKDGSAAVMIPVSALVDADGKQLVFVQYEKFYEPVPVTTGGTKGELVEVTKGLSIGEKLVTQGSLSLYAESRKTQTADAASPAPADPQKTTTHAQADARGLPHSHDSAGNMTQGTFPLKTLAIAGGGATALLVGGIAIAGSRRNKKGGV